MNLYTITVQRGVTYNLSYSAKSTTNWNGLNVYFTDRSILDKWETIPPEGKKFTYVFTPNSDGTVVFSDFRNTNRIVISYVNLTQEGGDTSPEEPKEPEQPESPVGNDLLPIFLVTNGPSIHLLQLRDQMN